MMTVHGYIESYAWYDAKQHPPHLKARSHTMENKVMPA